MAAKETQGLWLRAARTYLIAIGLEAISGGRRLSSLFTQSGIRAIVATSCSR
jgi:hypothetical protein